MGSCRVGSAAADVLESECADKKKNNFITFRSADFFIGCNSVSKCQRISNPGVSIAIAFYIIKTYLSK